MRIPILLRSFLIWCLSTILLAAADPQKVPVWPGASAPNGDGSSSPATTMLTVYRPEHPNGAAMVICPGGGYAGLVTEPEGHGIARWLAARGVTGLVLEYRLPAGKFMVPLLDAQRAIRLARANAGAWKIDPGRIGIIGFSAGGHLAATAATHFDDGAAADKAAGDPVARFSSRPDFAVLIYPVITMGEQTHPGSRDNLLGPNPSRKLIEEFSAEKQVTSRTPPTFLAHAKDDALVPIRNSQLFADALKSHRIPFEFLPLESGGHGLNGYQGASWDAWQVACLKWLESMKFLQAKSQPVASLGKQESTIPVSDPKVQQGFSSLNWIRNPQGMHSSVCGASFKLAFPGTDRVALKVDTSRLNFSSPDRFPILAWTVNNGPVQTYQLSAGDSRVLICDGIANPAIDFYIKGMSPFEDRFQGDIPANSVSITGFSVLPGCRGAVPAASAPLWLNIGDSILSGDGAGYALRQGRPVDDLWAASDDARASYGYLLAQHYGYRESRLAFGGYAWTGGLGNNPAVEELIDRITSTRSRLADGADVLAPSPRVVLINLGENGAPPATSVIAGLTRLRRRCGMDTRIIVMVPVSGRARTEVTEAVKSYLQSSRDPRSSVVDLGQLDFDTVDGQHPSASGHQTIFRAALPFFDKLLK